MFVSRHPTQSKKVGRSGEFIYLRVAKNQPSSIFYSQWNNFALFLLSANGV